MKRILRIEVVRYSRQVIWGGNDCVDAPDNAEPPAALLLTALAAATPVPDAEGRARPTSDAGEPPATRPSRFRRLKDWLRRG